MKRLINITICLAVCSFSLLQAQAPKKLNSSEIFESVQKLNVLGSVLYVAAHPDDENTRLISYMANEVKARTAYLSITRGDGGQNLIGPELRELLGLIRTQELLAARRIDGGEQLFTRANDFGFSKHPDETLKIWDKDAVLIDVIWAIRTFKPDIIINRFNHRTPGTTHGHHTSSAMLSLEAFDLASNPKVNPEQLQFTSTWQPKRLFFNTSWWFYGNEENFEKADKSKMITFDVGVYYPLKGLSNNEVAAIASSQHLCQGFGRLTTRGSQNEYIEFLKGEKLNDNTNIFDGIDTSWNRVKGGAAVGDILTKIESNFNFANPEEHLPDLVKAYQLLQNVEDKHWKQIKSKELTEVIEACTGLYLEAAAGAATATSLDNITINIEAINRSNSNIKLNGLYLKGQTQDTNINKPLLNNDLFKYQLETSIDKNTGYTSAYWLLDEGNTGMYKVSNQKQIGQPLSEPAMHMVFNITIEGVDLEIIKPLVYRYSKPDKGEQYKPFEILPKATVKSNEKVMIFNNGSTKTITFSVQANTNNIKGKLRLKYPGNWRISPTEYDVDIALKNDERSYVFSIEAPQNEDEVYLIPQVEIEDEIYSQEKIEIDYSHIPFQTVLLQSKTKLVKLDIEKKGHLIGYIEGAGDVVPESLKQIGYKVEIINTDNISAELLEKYDAIVTGIRAYNTIDALKYKQQILFDYVENGGNLIVQYNTSSGLVTQDLAPFKLKLSRDRVTDEAAEVKFLAPNHPVLNFPNKITSKDFKGWTQERGLYFPGEWSNDFTAILAMNDAGETSKQGSLLVAPYGKGYYIYTGLSFFREFPEGVSGAYRLFANMLSLGKTSSN
jgi:LmbE family N-acetylglucosaminyl deacetylase